MVNDEGSVPWQIHNALVGIAVKDFASAVASYERLTGRDDQLVELEAKGTPAGRTSEKANIAIVTDPDGNQVVFAEALTDRRGTDAQRVRG